jgi:outer membrane receptor protein involved in Fe transport
MPGQQTRAVASALAMACAGGVAAQEATLPATVIQGTREDVQGSAASASEGVVTSRQLRTRPLQRAGDIMESVPGLIATQHAGEGKANQYFLRGFNLDHGTDFATFVDGVPINLPTHGHGQGYTDLYFVIPELVDAVQYRKGPYYAEEGDFAAVGSARIRTVRRLAQPFASLEVGSFGYRRALSAGSLPVHDGDLLLAAEHSRDDGPWTVPERLRKTNLTAKYTQGSEAQGLQLGFTHYEARWISTDQVPQRAIDSGLIGRYGSLDPTTGGRTRRTGIHATWNQAAQETRSQVTAYALRYSFDLFSDFSYATRGCDAAPLPPACDANTDLDQFEQVDRRHVLGLVASRQHALRLAGRDTLLSYGIDLRRDAIGEVGLYDTFRRTRLVTVRSDSARVDALGLWSQAELQFAPEWRATAGLRWDQRSLDVTSSVPANSGRRHGALLSPKASLAWSPSAQVDWYANWGHGFHSNDARGTVLRVDPRDGVTPASPADPLVRATGYELGTRQKWAPGLTVTAALWSLELASELVFVGDAGSTEASRPSLRRGIELTSHWQPAPGWDIDADLSLARARFRDRDPAGNRIPGAMERVATLGVSWTGGPWTAGARLRHFGSHALIEDNSLRGAGSTLTNVRLAYRFGRSAELALDIFNLFDRKVADVQYAYASRLPGEAPFADGVTPATVHLHPSTPRMPRVGLKLFF